MAQGQGAGPRRGGAEGGARALTLPASLTAGAAAILATADPAAKAVLSRDLAAAWRAGRLPLGRDRPPERPARPLRPPLRPPREMPRRRALGSPQGRGALLHALAHIELNAIDLAWDLLARAACSRVAPTGRAFGPPEDGLRADPWADPALPRAFFDDWAGVAAEEAGHFELLSQRLGQLGLGYGDLPAHDGLWEAAAATADDLLARLAIVPLVFEARGLDVTPEMRDRLMRAGDRESAALLDRLYRDEIGHVAIGARWFEAVCAARNLAPIAAFHDLVRRRFAGGLKPPFNDAARAAAGFSAAYYAPLAAGAG